MGVRDLGDTQGPLLIFGGPYSNLAATEALQAKARALGVGPERIICTGDLVAYCAQPEETLALVRTWGIPVVMGNCEEALARGAPDCGCGFEPGSTCDALSVSWYRFASRRVSAGNRAWMEGLPRRIDFRLNGRHFAVIHGGVSRINEFHFASSSDRRLAEELDRSGADVVIGGHCGIPFGRRLGQRAWLNAGVIGLPANDGSRDGWFLLLYPEDDAIRCRWERLAYDAEGSARHMRETGLDGGYADSLLNGRWPSQQVLPEVERQQQGQRLRLPDLVI